MWPRTDFLELLGITHPVIQAPMAGFAPPALAAAVCNAGGLGSIGCAGIPPATVRDQITALRQATNRPYNLNFFVHSHPRLDPEAAARMRTRLAPYFDEFGLGPVPEPTEPFPPFDEERLELVLELRPQVVSFHFGLPDATAVRRVKEAGCIILSSATTVAEARSLEANGADVIIAQGFDAGGHRGSFSGSPGAGLVGTMALVPQIVDAVRLPVIAAGGIADGRGLAAAFALGAKRGPARHGLSWMPRSNRFAAASRAVAQRRRRRDRADARLYRPPGPRIAQSLHYRDGRQRALGVPAAGEPRRPALAIAERGGARRVHAGLGGSGRILDQRAAGRSVG